MSLENTILVLRHPKGILPNNAPSVNGPEDIGKIAEFFRALSGGAGPGQPGDVQVELHRGSTGAAPAFSKEFTTIASGAGSLTETINGVAIAITWATSDANSASLLAAAVNASSNALVVGLVRACNIKGTITLATVLAGEWVEIAGHRLIARNGGFLAQNEFSMAGTDTADAASLVTCINAHPRLRELVFASSSAGVVTVRQLSGTTALKIVKQASTLTVSALAASADTLISSIQKGKLANAVTIAASGTGHTVNGGAARLSGGVGGDAAPKVFTY